MMKHKRMPVLYYDKHPNNKYWQKKGDTLFSFIINRGNCAICGNPDTQAHHILTKGSYPQYRHNLMDGIPLCYQHHMGQRRGLISAHGSPLDFMDWLEANRPEQWKWVQMARKADEKRKLTWKESYEKLLNIAKEA